MFFQIRLPLITALLLLLSALAHGGKSQPAAFTYSLSNSLTMPLANISFVEGHHQVDEKQGILIDLGHTISKALGMPIKIDAIPRNKIINNLLNGQSDVVCYLIPKWLPNAASSVNWTEAFMQTRDILISKKSDLIIDQLSDLEGQSIALIKHYRYPLLNDMLSRQLIHPIYSTSEANSFIQLFKNPDVDAIVLKELVFDWLAQKHSGLLKNSSVTKHPLVIEFVEPKCAVSRYRSLELDKINLGIQRFKEKHLH